MLEHKKTHSFIALLGAAALLMSAPVIASAEETTAPAAAASAAAPEAAAPAPAATEEAAAPEAKKSSHDMSFVGMFMGATTVVKLVMIGLLACSVISWIMLVVKSLEFSSLNKQTSAYLEAFRGARSIEDINRVSSSDEFAGNPMADMAAVFTDEVKTSKSAGLQVSGEHKDHVLNRGAAGVNAVQSGLSKRLNGGMSFLASVGSAGPFIGLFGTVYGIMNSFIGIANSHTTNLAVVAPGIAEALMATGIGLIAAIPAVIMYNIFNGMISAYGTRSEMFVAELSNQVSRQLDRGA